MANPAAYSSPVVEVIAHNRGEYLDELHVTAFNGDFGKCCVRVRARMRRCFVWFQVPFLPPFPPVCSADLDLYQKALVVAHKNSELFGW